MRNKRVIYTVLGFILSSCVQAAVNNSVLNKLAKQQGFFFFFNSSCPHCQRFAPILKRFSQQYGFSVLAISVDGGFLPSFPDAVMNEGQTQTFQVQVYPTLFLVNPKSQRASLVTEGALDETELTNRLLKINQTQEKEASL